MVPSTNKAEEPKNGAKMSKLDFPTPVTYPFIVPTRLKSKVFSLEILRDAFKMKKRHIE